MYIILPMYMNSYYAAVNDVELPVIIVTKILWLFELNYFTDVVLL